LEHILNWRGYNTLEGIDIARKKKKNKDGHQHVSNDGNSSYICFLRIFAQPIIPCIIAKRWIAP
jgi:hypothetical protein